MAVFAQVQVTTDETQVKGLVFDPIADFFLAPITAPKAWSQIFLVFRD
jgi:hypothetical protein